MPKSHVIKHHGLTVEAIHTYYPQTDMVELKYRRFASRFLVRRSELAIYSRDTLLIGQVTPESVGAVAS